MEGFPVSLTGSNTSVRDDKQNTSPGCDDLTVSSSVKQIRIRHALDARVLAISRDNLFKHVIYHFNMLCSSNQSVDPDECVISPQMGNIYLDWNDKVGSFLDIAWVFREQPYSETSYEENIETLLVTKRSEVGDASRRVSLEIDPTMSALYTGFLYKKGSGSLSSFKRRWFVLQNMTLYYMDEPSSPVATGCIPMGGVELKLRPDLTYKDKICFELTAEHLGLRNFVMAGDQAEIDMLQSAMDLHQLRRMRGVCVDVMEELLRRDVSRMQGIFRVSGDKATVDSLRAQLDLGQQPSLAAVLDEHALASLAKHALRSLRVPLLTHTLYPSFIAAAGLKDEARIAALRDTVAKLPFSTRTFLHYLCLRAASIAAHAETNLMTTKNLAIVFAPNILRPAVETAESTLREGPAQLVVVQALLDNVTAIFGPVPAPPAHVSAPTPLMGPCATPPAPPSLSNSSFTSLPAPLFAPPSPAAHTYSTPNSHALPSYSAPSPSIMYASTPPSPLSQTQSPFPASPPRAPTASTHALLTTVSAARAFLAQAQPLLDRAQQTLTNLDKALSTLTPMLQNTPSALTPTNVDTVAAVLTSPPAVHPLSAFTDALARTLSSAEEAAALVAQLQQENTAATLKPPTPGPVRSLHVLPDSTPYSTPLTSPANSTSGSSNSSGNAYGNGSGLSLSVSALQSPGLMSPVTPALANASYAHRPPTFPSSSSSASLPPFTSPSASATMSGSAAHGVFSPPPPPSSSSAPFSPPSHSPRAVPPRVNTNAAPPPPPPSASASAAYVPFNPYTHAPPPPPASAQAPPPPPPSHATAPPPPPPAPSSANHAPPPPLPPTTPSHPPAPPAHSTSSYTSSASTPLPPMRSHAGSVMQLAASFQSTLNTGSPMQPGAHRPPTYGANGASAGPALPNRPSMYQRKF